MRKVGPTDKIFVPKYFEDASEKRKVFPEKCINELKQDLDFKGQPEAYQKILQRPNIYPKRNFWCNFDKNGKQKWFIELSNGRLVSDKDENYFFWLKKYTEKK